jgi:adenylosuccinate synthase
MPGLAIIGCQWGDEGKGRVVDLLSNKVDMVVRFQGGDNAGHTVVKGNDEFKLHLIPSGILYPEVICVIGNGVVLNPEVLIEELDDLESKGINTDNLRISSNAHLVMPYHIILDKAGEHRLGKSKIGTTHKGIGPVYADKALRMGIRTQDLKDLKIFKTKLEESLKLNNKIIKRIYGLDPLDMDEVFDKYRQYGKRISRYIIDTTSLVSEALDNNKKVMFEGAQGTMLDIDHGTYPYVTSSSTIAGGVCVGAGIGPSRLDEILGVVKAYTTRVGSGPFPTEDISKIGDYLREKGYEYGTTTGRPRRCGWLDAVILKYSIMINSIDSIALTKLDILSGLKKVKICTGYKYDGKVYDHMPCHQTVLHKCTPVYEEYQGWSEDISGIKNFEDLPRQARNYIKNIEKIAKVAVSMVSVGAERSKIIMRDHNIESRLFDQNKRSTLII